MFSTLPDLTPRDSHSLWYISSRNPNLTPAHLDPSFLYSTTENGGVPLPPGGASGGPSTTTGRHNSTTPTQSNNRSAAHQAAIIERSALGRLRADELYMERRRANVANLGSTWLKPPGVAKTLFQMREERREQEEHAEAVRREMLAQELAEAEAAGVAEATEGVEDLMGMEGQEGVGGDNMMMDEDGEENGEGGRDLDDDIPDADEGGFGFDGISDDEEEAEEEEESEEESEESDEDGGDNGNGLDDSPRRQRRELANRIGNMRATEDAMRERLATHGTASQRHVHGHAYGGDEDIDEEDQADILDEDDLLQGGYDDLDPGMEDDLDMDANLDDEIPEAGSLGGYEHTDSEAELSSEIDEDEDEERDMSYAMPGPSGGSARRRNLQPQFGRNPAQRISSSGPYALPPYSPRLPQTQAQAQGEWHSQRQHHQQQRNRDSLASSHRGGGGGQRSSLDISGLLSQDGSSLLGSSPRMRR
ncbi:Apc15p domain containing protein [Naviculisporaceae sp. PSN 640]